MDNLAESELLRWEAELREQKESLDIREADLNAHRSHIQLAKEKLRDDILVFCEALGIPVGLDAKSLQAIRDELAAISNNIYNAQEYFGEVQNAMSAAEEYLNRADTASDGLSEALDDLEKSL